MRPIHAIESLENRRLFATGVPGWSEVNDFAYQLQNINLKALGQSKFDLVVIDYSRDGSDERAFTRKQIRNLQSSPGGAKRVLSYLSIGEAETYRYYWRKRWDSNGNGKPDRDAPSWLGPENPEWEGNYKVKYWKKPWQAKIFNYVDKIVDAGFDGVYMDIIDAFEYYEPGGDSGLDRPTAQRDMVKFVQRIARHAREQSGNPDFGVFVQNGEALGKHDDYLAAVTGIGREDTWYDGNRKQPKSERQFVLNRLDRFHDAGKIVLSVDYVTKPDLIDDLYRRAQSRGYVPYATVRDLDELTINDDHPPD